VVDGRTVWVIRASDDWTDGLRSEIRVLLSGSSSPLPVHAQARVGTSICGKRHPARPARAAHEEPSDDSHPIFTPPPSFRPDETTVR